MDLKAPETNVNIGSKPKMLPNKIGKDVILYNIIPGILLLGLIGMGALVAYPKYSKLPEKKAQIEQLTQKDQILGDKIQKLNDLNDFKDIIQEDSTIIDLALPSEARVPLLLTQVQKIALDSGLTITNLTYAPMQGSEKNKANLVNVLLTAKGNYKQCITFLKSIESASRLIDLSTLRFTTSNKELPGNLETTALDMNVGLYSAYLPAEAQAIVESPITVDIRGNEFVSLINKLKSLKVYDVKVDNSNIGKENPFNK